MAAADAENSGIAKRIAQSGKNFTQQTNVVDVDKHMMAFIERELKKRRAAAGMQTDSADVEQAMRAMDPKDELYQIAEKYRETPKPCVVFFAPMCFVAY